MLRRNSCRSQSHRPLSRSKSSASIVRNPVHELTSIEPSVAERDAYIAATLSYHRAQPPSDGGRKSPRLHRQQSVRFVGPNAQPRRRLATRASMAAAINVPRRPVDAQQQLSQFSFEPGDDAASLASYGRLRKSRSLYTPSITKTPNYSLDTSTHSDMFNAWLATPRNSSLARKENEPFRGSVACSTLRTSASTAFIPVGCEQAMARASEDKGPRASERPAQNESYEPPPDIPSNLRSRPSSFFRSSHNRYAAHSTGFPKSLRSSSNNTGILSSTFFHDPNVPPNMPAKQPGLRKTARKISRSLKSRLKGLFSRPKSRESVDTTMGPVESYPQDSYPPDLDLNYESYSRSATPATVHSFHEASMYRVPSHMPSFHAVPPDQLLRSRQASLGSIEDEEDNMPNDERSRVTSWTDSTAATDATRPRSSNWSLQYASGLRGDDVNASSFSRHLPHQAPVVDSQRVYSALMKRLHETRRHQSPYMEQGRANQDPVDMNSLRSNSTIRRRTRHSTYEGSSHTIRHVQEEDDVFQDHTETAVASRRSSTSTESVARHRPSSDYDTGPGANPDDTLKPETTVATQKPLISSRSSAFFASPTYHLFRTTSPYRRALQKTMQAAQASEQPQTPSTQYLESLSAFSLPTRRPSINGSDADDERLAYSESVYSTASEKSLLPHGGSRPLPMPPQPAEQDEEESTHGDATIFLNNTAQHPPLPSNHLRDVSSGSSVEWKTWLSANVSKLETPSTTLGADFAEEPSSASQPFRHIREDTEIEPEGEAAPEEAPGAGLALRPATNRDNYPSTATTMTQEAAKFQFPNPWSVQSPATNENSPPTTGARSKSIASKDASPAGPKSKLRAIPSVPNVTTHASTNAESPLGLPRMHSLNTLTKPYPPMREEMRLKRQSRTRLRPNDTSAKSSPGLTTAFERQFGVSNSGSPGVWKAKDRAPAPELDAGLDDMGRRELDAQAMGSRRMVDLFLSSRRKRTASSHMGQSSDSSAFI